MTAHAAVIPGSEILARWESRIFASGLHTRGRAGVASYLGQYGKGIRPPKLIQFARLADIKGCPELAAGFWEHAFFLETGERATLGPTSAEPAARLVVPALKESFGQLPQLLTAVDEEEALRLASQPGIGIQEKKNGCRLLTKTVGERVTGGNKLGLLTAVPLPVADDLLRLGDADFDGERIGATYHVFDLLEQHGADLRGRGFLTRYRQLVALFADYGEVDAIKLVPVVTDPVEKLRFITELKQAGKEGFVLKRLDAPYVSGASPTQWKFQFRASASFIAGEANPNGRRSVQLFVLRADGTRRDLGFVTVPPSAEMPRPGDIVSVRYLYVHAGSTGKLHQPVFEGIRPPGDAEAGDCLEAKLKIVAADDE
ncbi:MAG: hypothetical protein HZA93_08780 [Verrucomicrobia bacterium]|nr:hypothetical protein [Verrucomicrobiota bacterium]